MTHPDPTELILRDLVDTLLQENVAGIADTITVADRPPVHGADLGDGEHWCRMGAFVFRGRPGGALQLHRLSRGPVWHIGTDGRPRSLTPSEILTALHAEHGGTGVRTAEAAADLRAAVDHTAVTLSGWAALPDPAPRPGSMLAGERIAATRNRPFHPTARAASGWSAAELRRYGPMRRAPLGMDWVAVRRDHLRLGTGDASDGLSQLLLNERELDLLAEDARRAGVLGEEYQPLPVHPWQFEHVLPREFAQELADREVVPLSRGLGRFHPTSSLRTLTTSPESGLHLKLPLGVATLGAARLLPPRYLDNGERAQECMASLLRSDPDLGSLVRICDERTWCGWRGGPGADDEFADRPGHLAAQIRRCPADLFDDPDAVVLPMAALAAHAWDVLGPALTEAGFDVAEPAGLFRAVAEAFCVMGLGFLRHGVLPELHGQNVVVVLAEGAVRQFVLRDHDTLRICPEWMDAAGTKDPGYRIKPGAPQSLTLSDPRALLAYLQTLGFQVNLYGIADALARHHRVDERIYWSELRAGVTACLNRLRLPAHVATLVDDAVLSAEEWPSRQVLAPLLRQGRSSGVSMPAGVGRVPNPLAPAPVVVR
ncbi:siderophore staphylobactin biosynthesis protein SbnC [Streptomyces piniterrae]|uniref:Siderophore staphylobactin biosynthesis protein SbnC n=1 Tax=Streptomyces piniterrae TaxID=2571125 RepID=A0A4U0NIT5_9ACTN|nr:IucA/IucC family protein [Streptomyces piniterrae]TJZ54179.1 siderophore staphylobactin biosynthesis protein SbnC [Streptomyces piniterrae]